MFWPPTIRAPPHVVFKDLHMLPVSRCPLSLLPQLLSWLTVFCPSFLRAVFSRLGLSLLATFTFFFFFGRLCLFSTADLELTDLPTSALRTEINGIYHHAWLTFLS